MKISLDATVAIMIAVGTLRVGFLASSDNVDTASKPRNDRHRIAAPAKIGLIPDALPSPVKGAIGSTVPIPDTFTRASTTNVTMKIACTAMMRKLALATETMPTMLSTVTTAIATRMITHAGIAGIAASR
jgi:hypothetical protein